MKKLLLLSGILLVHFVVHAQYKVTFVVSQLPSYTLPDDKVYLVGSFNGWNPADEKMLLKPSGETRSITIEIPKGSYEYKFTKGSWDKVESMNGGFHLENRRIVVETDMTVTVNIAHWSDFFPKSAVKSSKSKNVSLLDSAFYIPQLNRYRPVRIYLPESYSTSGKNYPVLYLHDGQNVFDNVTSGFGEWGVDEALDTLGPNYREVIVVAIDHGKEKRVNEYSPYDMDKYGKGEGDAYVDFLKKTLKPYIDKKFRTKKDRENTFIAGSSMGGLISFHAILKYPKTFGGAGVFSPAFWITPQLKNISRKKAKKVKGKIYFYGGLLESDSMVPDMLSVSEFMDKYSKAKLETVIRSEGKHNEAAWREEFPLFYRWMIGRPIATGR